MGWVEEMAVGLVAVPAVVVMAVARDGAGWASASEEAAGGVVEVVMATVAASAMAAAAGCAVAGWAAGEACDEST